METSSLTESARNGNQAFPIAIIGAGFAGIGMAIQLLEAGIESFTIYERAGEIGGTWRDNTYPGAACDVPSHVYSLSFEPKADWSRAYATSDEIQGYLLSIVEKWNLRRFIRFDTKIVEARFDEKAGRWALKTEAGEQIDARLVVAAMGGLTEPAYPDIKGIDSFSGKLIHTARWDHDYDLHGKKVGVIGTGASAVQVVPSIAPEVERLTVFQRTAAWVMPKPDKVYSASEKRFFADHPLALKASRYIRYWLSELFGPMVFLNSDRLSALAEHQSLRHLHQSVSDPELRRKLTPRFQFGCKRVLISNDYWSTFERDNVDLVTEPIEEIRSAGIATADGVVHSLDAIVFATGFDVGLASTPFPVYGRAGTLLDDAWADGARAYKGMTVSGFPNWFILMGPNTGPGHTSVLVYTEAQIAYVVQAIQQMRARHLKFVDVKPEVIAEYNKGLQARMPRMAWASGCNSWYLNADGSNSALYPGFAAEYILRARHFEPEEYDLAPQ